MSTSIARRIYRKFFVITLLSVLILSAAVVLISEDLERSMVRLDINAERTFLLDDADGHKAQLWHTASLVAAYIPDGTALAEPLHPIFTNLRAPFSGELDFQDSTYLVAVQRANGGTLYLAKNIGLFEHRQKLFIGTLLVLAALMLVLGMVLAEWSTRRLVSPLRRLAEQLQNLTPGKRINRISDDFQDTELLEIGRTFNRFLDELEAFVRREQSLLSLASHELRTPLAVMSGALEVLDSRGQLQEQDQRTLRRLQDALDDMKANVDVLLKLVRRQEQPGTPVQFYLSEVLARLAEETRDSLPELASRLVVRDSAVDNHVLADPILVRMLLRNLVQNALKHTQGTVEIWQDTGAVLVHDQGPGLPPQALNRLTKATPTTPRGPLEPGLGLFIVTLISEQLGWRVEVVATATGTGTTIGAFFPTL